MPPHSALTGGVAKPSHKSLEKSASAGGTKHARTALRQLAAAKINAALLLAHLAEYKRTPVAIAASSVAAVLKEWDIAQQKHAGDITAAVDEVICSNNHSVVAWDSDLHVDLFGRGANK
jgi:hypothetical protein